jgi:hypothetical protein
MRRWIENFSGPLLNRKIIYQQKDFLGKPLQIQILGHMIFFVRLGHRWDFLDSSGQTDLESLGDRLLPLQCSLPLGSL